MRVCKWCDCIRLNSEFTKGKNYAGGIKPVCKYCLWGYQKVWRLTENGKTKTLNSSARWRAQNKAKTSEIMKEYNSRLEVKIRKLKWDRENNLRNNSRNHLKREFARDAIKIDPRLIMAHEIIYGYFGEVCMYPGCDRIDVWLDHINPLAKGGAHSFDNFQVLCKFHNQSKGARSSEDYRPVLMTDEDINELCELI